MNVASLRSLVCFPTWLATIVSPPSRICTLPYRRTELGKFRETIVLLVLNLVASAANSRSRDGAVLESKTEQGGRRTQLGSAHVFNFFSFITLIYVNIQSMCENCVEFDLGPLTKEIS